MSKIVMICFSEPGLTEELHIVHKEEFPITCKKDGREPQEAWSQDELIGGKPPVVK
jgi:hypothetical protein